MRTASSGVKPALMTSRSSLHQRLAVLAGRLLERALAHDVAAQRTVLVALEVNARPAPCPSRFTAPA